MDKKISKEVRVTEGIKKGLVIVLTCLTVLIGTVSCSTINSPRIWSETESIATSSETKYSSFSEVKNNNEIIPSIRFSFNKSQEYGVYVKIYQGKKLVFSTTLYRGETKWKETQVRQQKSFFDDAQGNLYENTTYSIYVEGKLAYQGPIKTHKIEITGYKDKNHIEQYKVEFKYF